MHLPGHNFFGPGTRPSKMWVDKGREFYNKDVQKLVALYSTENEAKSCVIETFNRSIKEKNALVFLC